MLRSNQTLAIAGVVFALAWFDSGTVDPEGLAPVETLECEVEAFFEPDECDPEGPFGETFCYECNPGCVEGQETLICGYTEGNPTNCPDEPEESECWGEGIG